MIRVYQPEDREELIQLIAQFRVTMSRFRGKAKAPDFEAAEVESGGYDKPGFKAFVAEDEAHNLVGYLVCRMEENHICADSLFVSPIYRRQGIGTALYQKAEELVQEMELDILHNQVHPNNDRMIAFLLKRGYNVLNMIELRRTKPGEVYLQRIKVGKNTFEYCC